MDWIETLRTSDEHPLCVISHFLPTARFPDLRERYVGGSLHQILTATMVAGFDERKVW